MDAAAWPDVDWSHVTGLAAPLRMCAAQRLQHFRDTYVAQVSRAASATTSGSV